MNQEPFLDDQGNWHFLVEEYAFDCVITQDCQKKIINKIEERFTAWIIEQKRHHLTHDHDPPYDHSGTTFMKEMAYQERADFLSGTLNDWLEEYSGNTEATFISGCGISHMTFQDEIYDVIREALWEAVYAQSPPDVPQDDFIDFVGDSDGLNNMHDDLCHTILKQVSDISAQEVFDRCSGSVIAQNKLDQQIRLLHSEYRKYTTQFLYNTMAPHLPDQECKIDKPLWRQLALADKLKEALDKANADMREMLQEVGESIHISRFVSNSVQSEICRIIHQWKESEQLKAPASTGKSKIEKLSPIFKKRIEKKIEKKMQEIDQDVEMQKMPPEVDELLDLILKIPGSKIVTLAVSGNNIYDRGPFSFDFSEDGTIGHAENHGALFITRLFKAFGSSGGLTIRVFTQLKVEWERPDGKKMMIPIKKLYGVGITDGKWYGLSKEEVRDSHNTDATTGEALKPEKAIVFCDFPPDDLERGQKSTTQT